MADDGFITVDTEERTRCKAIVDKRRRIGNTNKYEIVKEPCGNTLFFGDLKNGKISIKCKRCMKISKIGNLEE